MHSRRWLDRFFLMSRSKRLEIRSCVLGRAETSRELFDRARVPSEDSRLQQRVVPASARLSVSLGLAPFHRRSSRRSFSRSPALARSCLCPRPYSRAACRRRKDATSQRRRGKRERDVGTLTHWLATPHTLLPFRYVYNPSPAHRYTRSMCVATVEA